MSERATGQGGYSVGGQPGIEQDRVLASLRILEERTRTLEAKMQERESASTAPASWLGNLLQGVTLLSIIGFAFWLGGMSGKVTATSDKVDKLNSVVLESRDSLSSRMATVEAKLDSIDKKLDTITENIKAKK
ncbi:MAG: hypothetical protein DMF67_15920 [Acidobacteria bacterium]|nr:MAG: hypothetical protein DMF67_15920 [Acidobacteriota bacterium]